LLAVYRKYVEECPAKHGLFLALLKMLRPAIQNQKCLTEWWHSVIRPTLTTIGYRREEIEQARDILLDIMVFDMDSDGSGDMAHLSLTFAKLLIEEYLSRTRSASRNSFSESGAQLSEDEFIATEMESIITSYGRKKPKVSFVNCF